MIDNSRDIETRGRDSHLIVGVGASAGGLEAYKALLAALPDKTGMTFLFVQHLDPKHDSLLAELLQPVTNMRVVEARQDLPLDPDTIYIIRPGTALGISDDHLEVSPPKKDHGMRLPVDHLFRSLALEVGSRAAGIVLSGAGSDGSAGLRHLKGVGGFTIAQDPATCQHSSMPQHAIDTGYIDVVLKLEDIPEALKRFAALPSEHRVESVATGSSQQPTPSKPATVTRPLAEADAEELANLLEDSAGFDLRMYKPATLARRIARRRVLAGVEDFDDYLQHLREDEDERQALVRDLLISVTDFFRDAEAFDVLDREVIVPWLQESTSEPFRCWVAGCATGEEAYSIGMSVLDAIEGTGKKIQIQIFATDLDEQALSIARTGIYTSEISEQMSSRRLNKYFRTLDNGTYQVRAKLRDTISFAVHDLTNDPPFSRMTLVSCRNVLIYLRPKAQRRLLQGFHFALRPNGTLFLGSSESLGRQTQDFSAISKQWRIYRKTGTDNAPAAFTRRKPRNHFPMRTPASRDDADLAPRMEDKITRSLIDSRVPPSVIVAETGEILYMHGDLRPFLRFPKGEDPRFDFGRMISDELATRTRSALYKSRRSGESVVAQSSSLELGQRVCITASPANDVAENAVLISFDAVGIDLPSDKQDATSPAMIDELERELAATREDLQQTVQELEAANEELRSSNEESVSMNEELQSSNEELEATTEELRSLNEELTTVNVQLREKIDQLQRAHDDLSNFFGSTNIATLFLDEDLVLQRFTPAAARLLDLSHGDLGRTVPDITRDFFAYDLEQEARRVLEDLTSVVRDIDGDNGRIVRREVQPYRTENRRIAGVVVTFLDVTELKKMGDLSRRLAAIVESSDDAIISKNLCGVVESWNSGAERLFGYAADEMVGQPITRLEPQHRRGEMNRILAELRDGKHVEHFETERVAKDGRLIDVSLTVSPLPDEKGHVRGASKVARDISSRKRAEAALRESEQRFRALVETQTEMVCRFRADGTILFVNEAYARAQGKTADELIKENFWKFIPAEERPNVRQQLYRITPAKPLQRIENRLDTSAGTLWMLWTNRGLEFDPDGRVLEAQSTGIDITDRKLMEERLREDAERKNQFLATLGHELRNPLAPLRTGLDLLQKHLQEGTVAEVRDMLDRQVQHLTRLVDDLVDVARISRGQVELRCAPVDLNEVVEAATDLSRPLIEERAHTLASEASSEPLPVMGDFDRLTQVVSNLLNNAASYTEDGGSIQVRVFERGDQACIQITDTGIGFPPSMAESLFDMYSRIPQHRKVRVSSGLGVGLPLARQLVELHGGSISGDSIGPGKGSTFSVRLPLMQSKDIQAAPSIAAGGQRIGGDEKPRRVLIVDDNVDAANALVMLLSTRSHVVQAAHDGKTGLSAVETFEPEVVLLDIGLPDIDGYTVARNIRKQASGKTIQLIALTGWGQSHDKQRALDVGFDAHLTKPADTSVLIELIEQGKSDQE